MRYLLALVAGCLLASASQAVVLVTESGKRIVGYLVSIDAAEVVIRIPQSGSSPKVERYPRKGLTVLESFKPERLEALKPAEPRAYRDYAEELMAKKEDPEARDLALRLLVIAASLDPATLGKGCMVAAAGIARDEREERRFKALAFLLDPNHDKAILDQPGSKSAVPKPKGGGPLVKPEEKAFLAALNAYRTGHYKDALKSASTPGVDKLFESSGLIGHAAFIKACEAARETKAPPDPAADLPRRILRLELESSGAPTGEPGAKPSPWAINLGPEARKAPVPLSLETVTEFSPTDSVFIGGKWARPSLTK